MRGPHMAMQIRSHSKILATIRANKRPLPGVRAHVDCITRRPIKGALAEVADPRPAASGMWSWHFDAVPRYHCQWVLRGTIRNWLGDDIARVGVGIDSRVTVG